jgi:hypothetical protein
VSDPRIRAPSAARNRDAILGVLRDVLPLTGLVLEIASGSGEHVVHFARHLPGLEFQPSDPDPNALASVAAWIAETGLANVRAPVRLDVDEADWPIAAADAILCINMIHIAPWRATAGLIAGAAARLPAGAPLYLYGPYRRAGVPTAPSNEEFDRGLRARDPAWGLRDLEAVAALARAAGFAEPTVVAMPANNLSVVLRRA